MCVVSQSGAQSAGGDQQRMCEKWRIAAGKWCSVEGRLEKKDSVSFSCWLVDVGCCGFLISHFKQNDLQLLLWQKKRRDVGQEEQEWAKTRNQVTAMKKGLCNITKIATSKMHSHTRLLCIPAKGREFSFSLIFASQYCGKCIMHKTTKGTTEGRKKDTQGSW